MNLNYFLKQMEINMIFRNFKQKLHRITKTNKATIFAIKISSKDVSKVLERG